MVYDIINSIAKNIKSEFGDGFFIYTKDVKQNFNTPAFTIINTFSSISQYFNNKSFCKNNFIIRYFDDYIDSSIYERLYRCNRYVDVIDGIADISNVSFDINNNVLNFSFECNFYIITSDTKQNMENINQYFL